MYEIKRGKGEEIMNNENYTFDIMRECYLKIMDYKHYNPTKLELKQNLISQIKELNIFHYQKLEDKSVRQLSLLIKKHSRKISDIYGFYLKEKHWFEK
jgi:hypothetical protein